MAVRILFMAMVGEIASTVAVARTQSGLAQWNDVIRGSSGNDFLDGGTGDYDRIGGGPGNDGCREAKRIGGCEYVWAGAS